MRGIQLPAITAFGIGTSATVCLLIAFWVRGAEPLSAAGMLLSWIGIPLSFLALILEPRTPPGGHGITHVRVIHLSLALSIWPMVLFLWAILSFGLPLD